MNPSKFLTGLNIIEKFINLINSTKEIFNKRRKSNYAYYFDDYEKNVTIYKNGNGIIINTATLVVTNSEKFDKIYRSLNIEDGDVNSNFPLLKEMMQTEIDDRFIKYGFWYDSGNNIINDAVEFYWTETESDEEDADMKKNKKELRWIFKINKGRIKNGERYRIIYIISVKGLYPITNGILDKNKAINYISLEKNASTFTVMTPIKNFRYIISFDGSITLKQEPECIKCTETLGCVNSPVSDKPEYNILYKKYIFEDANPIPGAIFKVSWKFRKGE